MFAPYCETCQSRILLGPRRIVHFVSPGGGDVRVTLRCFCGSLVAFDAQAPARPAPRVENDHPSRVGAAAS